MFAIIGSYNGHKEIIDEAETIEQAHEMLREYRMAYGNCYQLNIAFKKELI